MTKEEVRKIVAQMPITCKQEGFSCDDVLQTIWFLKKSNSDDAFGLIDIFNFGMMLGKQQERAKRKANN